MTPTRYITQADENALFEKGVASWRLDVQTTNVLNNILQKATWNPIPKGKSSAPNVPEKPVGVLTNEQKNAAQTAVDLVLNDPVLFPNLRQMGRLKTQSVELQNGAFDDAWHHDHLSNTRGHAGQFFFITYLGEKTWEETWGGGFFYGRRNLSGNWVHNIDPPQNHDVIWPKARTALLGWNEHPSLIHRAQFLTTPKNRTAFLMPVNITPF